MKSLNQKDYKILMNAIYNVQINDAPPPEFNGKTKMLANVIFPCIERRKAQSKRGRLGADARYARPATLLPDDTDKARSINDEIANGGANSGANDQSRVKIEKNKIEYNYNRAESNKADGGLAVCINAPADAQDALSRSEKEKDVIFEIGNGYGTFGNVYLSTEEYLQIKKTIANADKYIDLFSQKLHDKGYQYPNHAEAILDWYEKDKMLPANRRFSELPREREGSFDTDEFFAAAVKRSLGSDGK